MVEFYATFSSVVFGGAVSCTQLLHLEAVPRVDAPFLVQRDCRLGMFSHLPARLMAPISVQRKRGPKESRFGVHGLFPTPTQTSAFRSRRRGVIARRGWDVAPSSLRADRRRTRTHTLTRLGALEPWRRFLQVHSEPPHVIRQSPMPCRMSLASPEFEVRGSTRACGPRDYGGACP